jgi:hypothetical protein
LKSAWFQPLRLSSEKLVSSLCFQNSTRTATLREERTAREAFEAELEAQTTENIRRVREEERERMSKLEGERETLMSALSDSKEMKGWGGCTRRIVCLTCQACI